MARILGGVAIGVLVLGLGLGSSGCGGDTGTPPAKDGGKKMTSEEMRNKMMETRKDKGKISTTGASGEPEKDKGKAKDKEE